MNTIGRKTPLQMNKKLALGKKLTDARENAGLTQMEMAESLNISRSTLYRYEAGSIKVSYDLVCRIAKICNLSSNVFSDDISEAEFRTNLEQARRCSGNCLQAGQKE